MEQEKNWHLPSMKKLKTNFQRKRNEYIDR